VRELWMTREGLHARMGIPHGGDRQGTPRGFEMPGCQGKWTVGSFCAHRRQSGSCSCSYKCLLVLNFLLSLLLQDCELSTHCSPFRARTNPILIP
jgi:hypothetical protein